MTGPADETGATAATDDTRSETTLTTAGVAAVLLGLAVVAIADPVPLRWLGTSVAALGVTLVGVPRTRPAGTGEEEPRGVTLPGGRPGAAFTWSRFAPGMTLVVLLASACSLAALGLVFLALGLAVLAVFFGLLGLMVVGLAARFLPTLRGRRLVLTAQGVVIEMRGERAELPWAAITAVDVGRPAPQAAAMGGAITLRTLEHEVPGPPGLQRRLRNLATPYGAGADVALPVAGLRHDPGALLVALERGPRGA